MNVLRVVSVAFLFAAPACRTDVPAQRPATPDSAGDRADDVDAAVEDEDVDRDGIPNGTRGIVAWLETFAAPWLEAVPDEMRARLLERIAEVAAPALLRDGVWWIDYVRLRVEAIKAG